MDILWLQVEATGSDCVLLLPMTSMVIERPVCVCVCAYVCLWERGGR